MRTNTSSVTKPARSELPDVIGLAGTLAGLGGGLAMAIVRALIALSLGRDIWFAPKQIAAIVYGEAAVAEPGFIAGPVIVGSLLHMVVSGLLGALFGIVTRRVLHLTSDFGTPLLAGLMYGLLIWMTAYYIVLPLVNPVLLNTYTPVFIVQHLVYGAVTGMLYIWLRKEPYQEWI